MSDERYVKGALNGIKKRYEDFINKWKLGEVSGMRGADNISAHIRKYLFQKFDSKCCECGWSKINPTTGKIPLEVEHIDGNSKNNKEENLKLLCPNCHSLTSTFKSLNKGKGRKVRLHKIKEQTIKEVWQSGLMHSP